MAQENGRRKSSGPQRKSKGMQRVIEMEARRESLPLAKLKREEEDFFEVIEEEDVEAVIKYLNEHRGLNINCMSYSGLTALQIAISDENHEVVKMLLNRPDIEIKDALLHAVESGNIDITVTVLDYLKSVSPDREFEGCADSPLYSHDVTPLTLAAQKGDYEMVRMLLERGHEMEKPHAPNCLCRACKEFILEHGAALSTIRLTAYKAISNPAYICQVTDDPILYAFHMDNELKRCAELDKEFMADYEELEKSVRAFTVDLISTCRDTTEIEMLLKLGGGYEFYGSRVDYPRLQLAIDYNQKEFVAQSLIQQVLVAHWLGEFRAWPRLPPYKKAYHIVVRMAALPVISLLLVTVPFARFMTRWTAPLNRYLLSVASYLYFLGFVFAVNYIDTGNYGKGPPTSGCETVVVIFVMGHILNTFRTFWVSGYKRFIRASWNLYDMVTHFFFLLTFVFWIVSYVDLISHEDDIPERKFWDSTDPTLLHEGFFAIATVLAFGKLAYFCLTSPRLGPFQVSMGKMALQISAFMGLCLIINLSFAIPLSRLYAYYDGMTQVTANGHSRSQLSSFSTLSNAFSTLFWGMFGMSPVESADVVVENLTDDLKNPVINEHNFTQDVGRVLFGLYEVLMIIALVNTLIAILSNTFQKVIDNADVEFKFARTKIYINYFDKWSILPSPFNLIPSSIMLKSCAKFFQAAGGKIKGAKAAFSLTKCCHVKYEKPSDVEHSEYEALMSNLLQRYFGKSREDFKHIHKQRRNTSKIILK